ncbi:uncharacterized protein LOC144008073 isoform X4 [Festucalex cinctus]
MAAAEVNGSSALVKEEEEPMDVTGSVTENYQILINAGLSQNVAESLNNIFQTGLVAYAELDERAIDALREFSEEGALAVLQQFKDSDLSHVQNPLGAESLRDTKPVVKLEKVEETCNAGDQTCDAGDQDNGEGVRELKGFIRNCEMFFSFSKLLKAEGKDKKKVYTGSAKCMHPGCKNKGVTYTSISRAHLISHYKTVHPEKHRALAAALARNTLRGRHLRHQSKKLSVEDSRSGKFSQDKARQMFTRWFVETHSPASLCEHPYTREMFAYFCPEFQLMSRRTLERDLDELTDKAKLEVSDLLSKQKWVATTADSWTVNSRVFLGVTVHWIDWFSLKRKKATLACRELKSGQTHQLLREVIHDIHQEFGIVKKVVATTTDSGANYVAAFNDFGEPLEKEVVQEEDEEVVLGQRVDVQGLLDGEDIDPHITLPPHRRCCTHTMNLMATTDIREVAGWSKGNTPWRQATAKAHYLCNLPDKTPIAASRIKEAIKMKLPTPVALRWDSYFNSVKVLLEVMSLPQQVEAINKIITDMAGVAISDQDIKVLAEYKDVLCPVVETLGSLQEEDNAYMGILLPTLLVLKRWLLQKGLVPSLMTKICSWPLPCTRPSPLLS